MPGHVFAVASGKGGVGKTTTAINLGIALRMHDRSVVIVDGDLGMPNLGTMVGVDHDPTIHEVLAGEADLDAALVEVADGFYLVPGNPDLTGFAAADPDELRAFVDALADRFEFVVLDTGAGLSYESVLPLEIADEVVFVTTADPSSLTDTQKTLEVAERLETPIRGVVLTRVGSDGVADEVAETLDLEVLAIVPEEDAVTESGRQGRPLQAHAPESDAAGAYRELGATLLDEAVANPGAMTATEGASADSSATDAESASNPDAESSTTASLDASEEPEERSDGGDRSARPERPAPDAESEAADSNSEDAADLARDDGDRAADEDSRADDGVDPAAPGETADSGFLGAFTRIFR